MDWKRSWRLLIEEAFNGVREGDSGTWFVEKKEAILPVLDGLTAAQASHKFGPKVNSIAAHARHTAYYITLGANYLETGKFGPADWEGSWSVQEVDEAQWTEIRTHLKSEFERLLRAVDAWEVPDQDSITGAMAHLAHAAFHLGAMRQLAMLV
ncbi:MAG: DinB family protein [Armatimonadota bacterium]